MNVGGVLFLLGRLLLALAVMLLAPAALAWHLDDVGVAAFVGSAALAAVAGLALQQGFRQAPDFRFGRREAFLLVAAAWLTSSIVGALPYVALKGPGFAVDGLFEAASGFTTTGASILVDVEAEPAALLLWRSLTHWLGGMGIIVLGIAILPKLAVGGMELFGAEAPGPISEKLTPRIAQTAKALWGIYASLTALEVLALVLAGASPFDAVNHAFATMATGGFSTLNESIAGYGNPTIELIILVFMVLAGANFALHFQLFRGRAAPLLRDREFRCYVALLCGATALVALDLWWQGAVSGVGRALRLAAFQVTSIVTTTGFATADFDAWPAFSRAALLLLMFVGGCAGSTGGSIKVVRTMIVAKKLVVDLRRLVQPRAVLPVRIGARAVPDEVVGNVMTFAVLFVALFALGGLALAAMGLDMVSAFSASAACLGNVGPGLGIVGPTHSYAALPQAGKLVLALLMIVGRLELYAVLVTVMLLGRRG